MSSQSRAERAASKGRERTIARLEPAREEFLGHDLNLQRLALAAALGEDPFTFSPDLVGRLKGGASRDASDALEGALRQIRGNAASSGVGVTSGPTQLAQLKGASGFANTLADRFLDIDQAAAAQRPLDIGNALGLLGGVLNDQFRFDELLANAELGAAGLIVQGASQPSPLAQIGGGLGSLAGTAIGQLIPSTSNVNVTGP